MVTGQSEINTVWTEFCDSAFCRSTSHSIPEDSNWWEVSNLLVRTSSTGDSLGNSVLVTRGQSLVRNLWMNQWIKGSRQRAQAGIMSISQWVLSTPGSTAGGRPRQPTGADGEEDHRLGWNLAEYAKLTQTYPAPLDHLESLLFSRGLHSKFALFCFCWGLNPDPPCGRSKNSIGFRLCLKIEDLKIELFREA